MQFQTIALTAVLATAIALPLPDLMGHFSSKRQIIPADISGAGAGALSGVTGASSGGLAGIVGALTGALSSVSGLGIIPI